MPESQRSLPADAQKPGFPIVEDRNGNGVIDEGDIYMDDLLPKLYYGFGNTFVYKNWDLDIYMYGQLGVEKYNSTNAANCSGRQLVKRHQCRQSHRLCFYRMELTNQPQRNNSRCSDKRCDHPRQCAYKTLLREGRLPARAQHYDGLYFRCPPMEVLQRAISSHCVFMPTFRIPSPSPDFRGDDPEIVVATGMLSGCNYPQLRTYSFGAKIIF